MKDTLKNFFNRGKIRISRRKERELYFYAAVVFFILYLLNGLRGG